MAGVFTVNASGAVTGGEQSFSDDFNFYPDNIVGATSSVVAGNNGNVLITLDTGDTNIGVAGVETFDASLVTHTGTSVHGQLIEYDTWASGSGTLDLQTSTAAPSGGYAFFSGGLDANAVPIVIGGVINVDTPGHISGAGSVFDENDDGTLSADQSFAPSTVSTPDSMGQVTFTLNPMNPPNSTVAEFTMVGYIVDANNIKWVENYNVDVLFANAGGVALGQNGQNGNFNSGSLSGSNGVFWAVGADYNVSQMLGPIPFQMAGLLTFNADLSLGGNLSYNDFIDLTPQGGTTLAAGGAWSVDASGTGRVAISSVSDGVNTYNFQLYLAHNGGTVISIDANDWVAGLGYGQGSGPFTAASFSGNYAMNIDQQETDPTGFEYDGVGTVTADGTTTPPSLTGSLDLNGVLGNPLTQPPGGVTVSGSFPTVNANGVFTGTITGVDTVTAGTPDNFTFYLIGSTSGASAGVIGIENDLTEQLTLGTFELQQP